jgi:hypothetical protein
MQTALQVSGQERLKKGLSHLHESLVDYLLINPGCTLRQLGAYFGYSPAWLCTVMQTDMFKAYLSARKSEVNVFIAQDLPSRLAAAAHLATERIIEVMERTQDAGEVIDGFDKILHRYGYAPNAKTGAQAGVVNNTQNVFYLNKADLEVSRQQFIDAHNAPRELPVDSG